jgi:hypothetical protein
MASNQASSSSQAPQKVALTTNENSTLFEPSSNRQLRPITDLWTAATHPTAATVAKECLSCDRWSGTMVAGGGAYLLFNTRRAPSLASKITMAVAGTAMVTGGIYQGWISNLFNVRAHANFIGFLIAPSFAPAATNEVPLLFQEYRGWPPI